MRIIDHGFWEPYQPLAVPSGFPGNAIFLRRADGTDWYDYVFPGDKFAEGSIKMTILHGCVGAAVTDATMLFPAGASVLEIFDVEVTDPQALFGGKVYDPNAQTFSEPPPMVNVITGIIKRLEALEAKNGGPP